MFNCDSDYEPFGTCSNFAKGMYSVDYGNFSNKFAFGGASGHIFVNSLTSFWFV